MLNTNQTNKSQINQIPKSYIKDVAIEIDPDYEFDNSPFLINSEKEKTRNYIGRTKNRAKLKQFLHNKSGVYLVTGYRGMGKTSFVNKSIQEYIVETSEEFPTKKIYDININLAQNELNEFDILKLMAAKVLDKYKEFRNQNKKDTVRKLLNKTLTYSVVVLLAILLIFLFKAKEFSEFLDWGSSTIFPSVLFGIRFFKVIGFVIIGFCLVYIFIGFFKHLGLRTKNERIEEIELLVARCYANVIKEQGKQSEAFLEAFNTRISGPHEKEIQNYPIATSKEIEYELSSFLRKISEEDNIDFIFIFDELDKVEPAVVTTSYYQDIESFEKSKSNNTYLDQLRDRKQAVLNIISGLKNFLTTARSNFIFIAGREMFDASLADIADRQSSISSMFNYVFYIDSLLKEKTDENDSASLSNIIEEFLKEIIFRDTNVKNIPLLNLLRSKGELESRDNETEQRSKVISTIQNFIIYLTYRSNGSPKKLIRSIHEFITIEDAEAQSISEKRKVYRIFLRNQTANARNPSRLVKFLNFNLKDQYRIGFINYLYRPFLIRHGRTLKENSDSIIVATPYLFDHLLKFHPFAFSLTNLELIPEVLATTKTPSLKEHIKIIIDYLSHSHIRETEIGLFDYKYYSRTQNELSFISKTFEEEGAAFNFTLDESYLVKLHIRSKIKELRSIYSKYTEKSPDDSQLVFSIAYLNGMLGDLHFFDEEYDDAIIAYSDAIKPINSIDIPSMNMRDFITLTRNKLKLGLCFEKINSYEESLAFYTDAAQDAKRFIIYNIDAGRYVDPNSQLNPIPPITYITSSLSDILQIVNQAFLAKLIVEEKMGIEGLTANKIAISCGGFFHLANKISLHCGKNYLIHANLYLMLGNILYFKNYNQIDDQISKYEEKIPQDIFTLFNDLLKYKLYKKRVGKKVEEKPVLSLSFYVMGIIELLENKLPNEANEFRTYIKTNGNVSKNIIGKLIEILSGDKIRKFTNFSKYHYKYIAIFLSNLGDCLLGIYNSQNTESGRINSLAEIFDRENVFKYFNENDEKKKNFYSCLISSDESNFTIADVFRCYHLSAVYFKKRGRNISAGFQYRKILYTLRRVLSVNIQENEDLEFKNKVLEMINSTIVHKSLIITSQNSEFSDRHMLKKFNKPELNIEEKYARNNISNHPESREIALLYAYLKLKITGIPTEENLVNSYNSIGTQYTRMMEIEYYAYLCEYNLKKIKNTEENIKSELASEYIYSLISLIRLLNLYGNDYMIGLSYKAYMHYKLGLAIQKYTTEYPNIIRKVKTILNNSETFGIVDATYNFQMAIQYYSRAKQLHQNGAEYKSALEKILYLEDDINDNAAHFGAALERYLINSGTIDENENICKSKLIDIKDQFQYEAYAN